MKGKRGERSLLWGEEEADEDGDGPDPLDAKGDSVGPFVLVVVGAFVDGRGEELANDLRIC